MYALLVTMPFSWFAERSHSTEEMVSSASMAFSQGFWWRLGSTYLWTGTWRFVTEGIQHLASEWKWQKNWDSAWKQLVLSAVRCLSMQWTFNKGCQWQGNAPEKFSCRENSCTVDHIYRWVPVNSKLKYRVKILRIRWILNYSELIWIRKKLDLRIKRKFESFWFRSSELWFEGIWIKRGQFRHEWMDYNAQYPGTMKGRGLTSYDLI